MKIHLIAIGGSVMHNLALSLRDQGHEVTGSDDIIYEPARSRLAAADLLPPEEGWRAERITEAIDVVILGMHAKAGNPELERARELKLPIRSFPEFLLDEAQNKQRVVIAGSHGKTSITAMVMHALHALGRDFDYMVGAQLEGFDRMVRLSQKAPMIILEGDEYPASTLDPRPKFLVYQPHLLVLTGLAWDHINAFPTKEDYYQSFERLLYNFPKAGTCIYNKEDKRLREMVKRILDPDIHYLVPYSTPSYRIRKGQVQAKLTNKRWPVGVYGKHNMANLMAAMEVCMQLGLEPEAAAEALGSFQGAGMRLETVYQDSDTVIIRDYAHAPSKLRASVEAVQEMYSTHELIVGLELHTYSSLDRTFLQEYANSLERVDHKVVYADAKNQEIKGKTPLTATEVHQAFLDPQITFATTPEGFANALKENRKGSKKVFLLMSSGNLGGLNYQELVQ